MSGKGAARRRAAAKAAAAKEAEVQRQRSAAQRKEEARRADAARAEAKARRDAEEMADGAGQAAGQASERAAGQTSGQSSGRAAGQAVVRGEGQTSPAAGRSAQNPAPAPTPPVPDDADDRPAAGPGSGGSRFRADVFTRRATRRHSERGPMSFVVDLYTAVFSLAVVLTMIGSTLYAFRKDFNVDDASVLRRVIDPQFSTIPTGTAISALTLLGLVLVISIAVRLGPMSATAEQAFWWLDLPIARASFLRGMLVRRCVVAFCVASVLAAPATLAFQADLNAGLGLLAAAAVGLVCVCAILIGALVQIYGGSRIVGRVGVFAAVLVFAAFVAESLMSAASLPVAGFDEVWAKMPTNWPQEILGGQLWPLAVLVALALALAAASALGLARLHAADLASAGAVVGHVSASLYFTDFNELGRAMAGERRAGRRGRLLGKGPRGPVGALVHAEALTFLRSTSLMPQLLVLAAAPVCVGLIAGFGNALAVAVVALVTGCWAAAAAGVAAKETAIVPELDALLPVSAKVTRRAHAVVPGIALVVWALLLFGSLALLGSGGVRLVVMGLIAAVGLAGASVRGAYRVAATSSAAPGMDMGMMPGMGGAATMIRNIFHGHDVAILSLVPVLITLFTGTVPSQMIMLQLVASAVAVLWGTHVKSGRSLAEMAAGPQT